MQAAGNKLSRMSLHGSGKAKRLTPRQLGQLVDIVPCTLSWLRDLNGNAGDLFLDGTMVSGGNNKNMGSSMQKLLKDLLNTVNIEGDMTLAQLKAILSKYGPEVVTNGVRTIVLDCEPLFVSNATGEALINMLGDLDNCETGKDCAKVLGPYLDEMPRSHYYALAELCAFLRDTCSDTAEVACLVGPALFSGSRHANIEEDHAAAAAAAIMDLLIEECEIIFGRMSAKSKRHALGERRRAFEKNQNLQKSALSTSVSDDEDEDEHDEGEGRIGGYIPDHFDARTTARLQQLIRFYTWRDPLKADRAHLLFENHEFSEIARAMYERYAEAMPPQWKAELIEMAQDGDPSVSWFNPDPAAAAANSVVHKRLSDRAATAAAGRRRRSTLDGNNAGSVVSSSLKTKSPVDRVIDELIDTEHHYHDCLIETVGYARHIKNIALGHKGAEAKQRLILSYEEIQNVFGYRLNDIVNLSKEFLANLEVIDLVRGEPKNDMGRPGLAAMAMESILQDLHIYAPYMSSHSTGYSILKKAIISAKKRPSGTKRLTEFVSGESRYKGSFAEIWSQVTEHSLKLQGQSIESVLIMPIQRIPRYKLLFGEMLKAMDKNHPAYEHVTEVYESIGSIADELNEALRQHEKIKTMLGDDTLMPTGSKRDLTRKASGKDVRVTNLYRSPKEQLEEMI